MSTQKQLEFACSDCSRAFQTPKGLAKHRNYHHGAEPLQDKFCDLCDAAYKRLGSLAHHMRKAHIKSTKPLELDCHCSICGEAVSGSRKFIDNHWRRVHDVKMAMCEECGKVIRRKSMPSHRAMHAGTRRFACQICGDRFVRGSSLVKHVAKEHAAGAEVTCQSCGKAFRSKHHLRKHMRRVHPTDPPVKCIICGLVYKSKIALYGHVYMIHRKDEEEEEEYFQDHYYV